MTLSSRTSSDPAKRAPLRVHSHHFSVSVPDQQPAIDWYCRVLDFELDSHLVVNHIRADVAFVTRGRFRIEICDVSGAVPLGVDRRVADLDVRSYGSPYVSKCEIISKRSRALRDKGAVVALGLKAERNPMTFIRDMAGNLFEFVEPFRATRHALLD